jgi:hypothetical protein
MALSYSQIKALNKQKVKLDLNWSKDPEWYTYYHGKTLNTWKQKESKNADTLIAAEPTKEKMKEVFKKAMEHYSTAYPCLNDWVGPVKIKNIPEQDEPVKF